MASRMLVTMALPYANGSLHLGHMVEAVQTDIFVRAMNGMGKEAVYICADDTHGTPIEISARKAGVPPEEYIAAIHTEHAEDYKAFEIGFDLFYTTHSPENEMHARRIFEALKADSAIDKRGVEQMYCPTDKRFLPDRYIRGTCPVCGTPDQYGDSCEKCGSTYEPTDLKNPRCAIDGNTALERRTSPHFFVRLSKYQDFLRQWTATPGRLQPEILKSLEKWLAEPLRDWDISRDAPYFGFKIPGEQDKYFYVWLDAPVGYLSSTDHWCQEHGRRLEDFWKSPDCDVVHFIGKDIVYFHTLFWPAMLHASGWSVPSRVHVHGMLTVEGTKMSKTRGTFINARDYLKEGLDPEWLRYFYAANLGPTSSDIDLSLNELKNRVNGELLNNVGNLANRALSLIWKNGGRLTRVPDEMRDHFELVGRSHEAEIARLYALCDTRAVVATALGLSQRANARLQEKKPWDLLKTDRDAALAELTLAVNIARQCARWLAPIVPRFARGVEEQSGAELKWGDFKPLEDAPIREPKPLVRKIEDVDIEKVSGKFVAATPAAPTKTAEINIDQFDAMDLRVGKVLSVERVPKKDKLLKLMVDLGEGAPRSIVSGVAKSYAPEELVGKNVAVVANLPPRDFGKGLISHGMVLFASGGAREHTAVELPADVAPGSKVK